MLGQFLVTYTCIPHARTHTSSGHTGHTCIRSWPPVSTTRIHSAYVESTRSRNANCERRLTSRQVSWWTADRSVANVRLSQLVAQPSLGVLIGLPEQVISSIADMSPAVHNDNVFWSSVSIISFRLMRPMRCFLAVELHWADYVSETDGEGRLQPGRQPGAGVREDSQVGQYEELPDFTDSNSDSNAHRVVVQYPTGNYWDISTSVSCPVCKRRVTIQNIQYMCT